MNFASLSVRRSAGLAFLHRPDDSVESALILAMTTRLGGTAMAAASDAKAFAESLDYNHPGQSKQAYLSHPMRVATDYLHYLPSCDTEGVVTALIHNVMEVTNVTAGEISARFGESVASGIVALTVDRDRQWDDAYKSDYYERLETMPSFVKRVKVFDKFDNLFFLCLNPSEDTRIKYLAEIERWIIPMARTVLPQIVEVLCELVQDNRRIGHRPLKDWVTPNVAQ